MTLFPLRSSPSKRKNHYGCRVPGIYLIRCLPTGDSYVGKSHDLRHRRWQHFRLLELGTHSNRPLQRLFDQHGASSFLFEVIEVPVPRCDLRQREQYWRERLRPSLDSGIAMRGKPNYKNRAHWVRRKAAKEMR